MLTKKILSALVYCSWKEYYWLRFSNKVSEKIVPSSVAEPADKWELSKCNVKQEIVLLARVTPELARHIPVNVYPAYAIVSSNGASQPPSEHSDADLKQHHLEEPSDCAFYKLPIASGQNLVANAMTGMYKPEAFLSFVGGLQESLPPTGSVKLGLDMICENIHDSTKLE
ncbi:hypothetical protein TIFTF001_019359 [Ficus carica]|uniref:Uncharacterized protein n=1 Tax=Ficus carica TaxID=3494 RepID=A0AA88DJE1_FICCA|nr:hypothetical protein TIFTF001_019359 [Ficus carica]